MEHMTNESKYPIHITVGTTEYKVQQTRMSATEIKQLAGLDPDKYDLFLEVDGPDEYEPIPDNTSPVILIEGMLFFVKHRVNPDVIISINGQDYTAPKHVMKGSEIKALAGIPADHILLLIPTSRADERIDDDQIVYLITDEQFMSMKGNINNGNTLEEAVQLLPQNEVNYLLDQGMTFHLVPNPENPAEKFLIIDNFDLGEHYAPRQVRLLVKIPQGFPVAEMDMFWVQPAVQKVTGEVPQCTLMETYMGSTWQRFSRHRDPNTWNPVLGGLRCHFAFIKEALRKGE